jgi:hypothetical protein
MGFFSKLKADMNHGGVKLSAQVPGSVASDQPIPITVTITTDTPQTVNSVTVKLEAEEREQGVNIGFGSGNMNQMGTNNGNTNYETVAVVENRDQFSIAPGDSKTISLQLYLNNAQAGQGMPGTMNPMGAALGGVLQSIAMRGLAHTSFIYRIHVSADIEGVGIGPHQNLPIQIAPPTIQQAISQQTPPIVPPASPQ